MLLCSPEPRLASESDYAACRAAIATGSRSFYAASRLLPASVRRPAFGLYAFCRLSDDAIDLGGGSLDALRLRLERACERRPLPFAADRAMADLIRRYAVPREVPEALLDGLGWDAEGRRYETLSDLHAYAARVAGSVGVMMCLLMGVRAPQALARACDLGVAMQLSNIARDVGEDARAGRVYLPLAWLAETGLDPDALIAAPAPSAALAAVIARLLAEADRLYARARSGVAELPLSFRPAILAAALIYADIGREIRANNHDSITRRARVSALRKLRWVAQACAAPPLRRVAGPPPLAEAAFLVRAVELSPPWSRAAAREGEGVTGHILRVLAIFERLERAEQFGD